MDLFAENVPDDGSTRSSRSCAGAAAHLPVLTKRAKRIGSKVDGDGQSALSIACPACSGLACERPQHSPQRLLGVSAERQESRRAHPRAARHAGRPCASSAPTAARPIVFHSACAMKTVIVPTCRSAGGLDWIIVAANRPGAPPPCTRTGPEPSATKRRGASSFFFSNGARGSRREAFLAARPIEQLTRSALPAPQWRTSASAAPADTSTASSTTCFPSSPLLIRVPAPSKEARP